MVRCVVTFDYDATQPDELTIKKGDFILDVQKTPGGWWEGVLNGKRGVFPDNFVEDAPADVRPPPANKPAAPGGGGVRALQNKLAGDIKLGMPPVGPKKPSIPGSKPAKQMAAVLFEYRPEQPDELELMEGDEVEIVKMEEEGWWEGVLRGKRGMFPSNFVKLLDHAPAPPQAGRQVYPTPPDHTDNKSNDIGGMRGAAAAPPGGRPPVEKQPKMPAPSPVNDSAPPPALPKRSRGVRAKVIYSYHAQNEDELTLEEGQMLIVTDQKLEDPGWWKGEIGGRVGVFPDNFVELIQEEEPPAPVRQPKPPPSHQPPVEEQPPINKPPARIPQAAEPVRQPPPPVTKPSIHKPPAAPAEHADTAVSAIKPMVNGGSGVMVDDKAVAMLREEIEKIKSTMVSRESFELLQRELKASKDALDTYKKDNNKKLADLMNEIDEVKKQSSQTQIDVTRIRKIAEEHWTTK